MTAGTKKIVVGAHYGTADWIAQRASAIVMAVYTVVLIAAVLSMEQFDYAEWAGLFAGRWMKLLTFVAFLSLLYHAWVGVRNIWMDYVKPTGVRMVLQGLTIVWLLGCAGYAVEILWRV